MKRQPKKEDIPPSEVLRRLTILRDRVGAELTQIETERAEERKKMEILRAAELAAPRKNKIYFRLARFIRAGVGPEIVSGWLRTPEDYEAIAKALRATERDVDRGGLRVVKSYVAAVRLSNGIPLLKTIEDQYRKLYPKFRVPERKSLARTLRRKELPWKHGKGGRPTQNNW